MDLPTYRQQQAHSFYEQLFTATSPLFFHWDEQEGPLPQIGGEPRGVTGYPFQGDNAIHLMMAAKEHGFRSPLWMTFDQAKACGGSVKHGENGTKILSWMGKDGDYKPILMTVFNGEQVRDVSLPSETTLSPEARGSRQAGLDALIAPRKRAPTPEQYVSRLREMLADRFPDGDNAQARAQAALRRELALMTACARLGLPRELDPSMVETLKPYAESRPNWREVEGAIDDAGKALKDMGVQPMVFDKITRREVAPEVKPAAEPAKSRTRDRISATSKASRMKQAVDIPF